MYRCELSNLQLSIDIDVVILPGTLNSERVAVCVYVRAYLHVYVCAWVCVVLEFGPGHYKNAVVHNRAANSPCACVGSINAGSIMGLT